MLRKLKEKRNVLNEYGEKKSLANPNPPPPLNRNRRYRRRSRRLGGIPLDTRFHQQGIRPPSVNRGRNLRQYIIHRKSTGCPAEISEEDIRIGTIIT